MSGRSYMLRCLVLKKTKLAETDAVVTLLAADGRQVRAVAKGVRKPGSRFGARLEPFSDVELLLHAGRNLEVVGDARSVRPNASCRESLEKASACAALAELLERVTRDAGVEPRVFLLVAAAFAAIDAHGAESAGLYAAACLLKAFAMLGVRPALRECALCGGEVADSARLDIAAGGVVCGACGGARGGDGDRALISWADLLLHATFAEIGEVGAAPVRLLLDTCESWGAEHLSVKLRSLPFLKTLY